MGYNRKQDQTDVLSFFVLHRVKSEAGPGSLQILVDIRQCRFVTQPLMETADSAAVNAGCSFNAE